MDDGGNLPVAFLLIGVAAFFGFMALRPWPSVGGEPIQPGAYALTIAEGNPPAGPDLASYNKNEVSIIQAGLFTLVMLWAAAKFSSAVVNIANTAQDALKAVNPISWATGQE